MCRNTGYNLGVHIQYAALGALFFLQFLQLSPKLIGRFGRSFQKCLVAIIRGVVILNKIACVDVIAPFYPLKAVPLFKICHSFDLHIPKRLAWSNFPAKF